LVEDVGRWRGETAFAVLIEVQPRFRAEARRTRPTMSQNESAEVPSDVYDDLFLAQLLRQLYASIFVGILVILLLFLVFLLPFLWNVFFIHSPVAVEPPFFATIMLFGAVGAHFSILTRINSFREVRQLLSLPGVSLFVPRSLFGRESKHTENLMVPNSVLLLYSLTPPIIGSISAVVLYLIFAAQLITGALFPEIGSYDTVKDAVLSPASAFLSTYGPKDGAAYAKVLLWSFVAGFAERLIPNALDSLGTSISSANKGAGEQRVEKVR
jgi:hypothetical protein